MSRIVYLSFPTGRPAGGQKMILRHVETLRALGFDAVCWMNREGGAPTWLTHQAPIEVATPFRPDDILVIPEDAPTAMTTAAGWPQRAVIFCQAHITFAAMGYGPAEAFPAERRPAFLTVSPTAAASLRRDFPDHQIELAPAFADERVFHPGSERLDRIVYMPGKRMVEAAAIRTFFRRRYARHADLPWLAIDGASEAQVAEALAGSTLFLALSRLEALGLTPLEAMASGCVCAGFTGGGGRDFARPENGFWAPDDDCQAAADQLAAAADLVRTGGEPLAAMREAGRVTAQAWSHAAFAKALEEAWMRLAPEARTRPRG